MAGFFEEVQRRKVYRVAVAYVIAAGFIIQIGSAVFPAWELPNWTLRLVVVLLLIGFPIALILAWAYDLTPQGIQATPKVPGAHRRRNLTILIAAGTTISLTAGFFLLPRALAHKIDKSIAVLPFENLSAEKENAYFADGMQDDILTNLSKIGDLKVISRVSVMSYRDGKHNAREIGKALGVATLLEGSVRRSGNRVRVNVQLINAENDQHLWAEDYDRDLTDVFAIQSDLAERIAGALRAKLSPDEKARLDRRPTQNPDAYLLYVRAHDYINRADYSRDATQKAEQLYLEATRLDPNFAAAFAGLSQIQSWIYHSYEPTTARRDEARRLAEKALQLDPDLPEGQLAIGFSYYYGDRDYAAALEHFEIAKRGLPNAADAYLAIGAIQRRQGKWKESSVSLEKAAELDPKNPTILSNLGGTYVGMRDYGAAVAAFDRAIAAAPESYSWRGWKAVVEIMWKADVDQAEKEVAAIPTRLDADGGLTSARVWILIIARKYPDALATLQQFRDEILNTYEGSIPKSFLEGILYQYQGDKAKARRALEHARTVAERLVQEGPSDAPRRAFLGEVLAALGEKEAAIVEGKRAAELLPESEDAYGGPIINIALAEIYTHTGESDEALRLIGHLLEKPNGLCINLLKLDPVWDPLRKDPRFQALIDKYEKQ